jgi:tRNA threonylcarbamoyladenosine biosynthesis protein TsaB
MALILNIETATEVCSVALTNAEGVVDFRENIEGRSHAALLTTFIDDIFHKNMIQPHQLYAIAVSSGPGSYTGLRIGVSVAKGLCYGANVPLIPISTLQSMAFGFIANLPDTLKNEHEDVLYCPMIDARRLEVYTALFNSQGAFQSSITAEIINENSFYHILAQKKVFFFGNGSDKCNGLIKHPNAIFYSGFYPSAKDMAKLSEQAYEEKKFTDIAYFEPYYLKDFIATTPKNKVLK